MKTEIKIEKEEAEGSSEWDSQSKKPYRAFMNEEWDEMKIFYTNNPECIFSPLTLDDDTVLHVAASSERTDLLQVLLDRIPPNRITEALSKKNNHGSTVFHEVAATSKVEAAQLLVNKLMAYGNSSTILKERLEDRNQLGETPLYRAVALGQTKMAKFIAKRVTDIRDHIQRNDSISSLHIAVLGLHFETAAWLLQKDEKLGARKGINGMTCLHLLAQMPFAFTSTCPMSIMKSFLYNCLPSHLDDDNDNDDEDDDSDESRKDLESGHGRNRLYQSKKYSAISRKYCAMWRSLAEEWPAIEKFWKKKRDHKSAVQLMKSLVKTDTTWEKSFKIEDKMISLGKENSDGGGREDMAIGHLFEEDESTISTTDTPLLIAAREGITEIYDEILFVHPQAMEHVSNDEENILHKAISHRQLHIFRRIKKMKVAMNTRLVSRINKCGYTLLHQVGDTKHHSSESKPGPALQLQEELKWLERVRKILPPHYVLHRDNSGKTADEFFTEQHAELLTKAQTWLKETAQSCSTVAVLIAGVVFAAAYTVPGGNDNKGRPIFRQSPFFLFFTIMDVISLAISLTSVVMFLHILMSPCEQKDFLVSLPRKLMIGFSLLFFSVTTTILSFSASILLVVRMENKMWTTSLIYIAAFLPVAVFAFMQFPIYIAFMSNLPSVLKKIMKKILPRKYGRRLLID